MDNRSINPFENIASELPIGKGRIINRKFSQMKRLPEARAKIRGAEAFSDIKGTVDFYRTGLGVMVECEIYGLPGGAGRCNSPIFAIHIHEGSRCSGNREDPFADTGGHFNPDGCLHPYHAGDLPPLFSNQGYALSAVLTDRFELGDVIGRTVVIHSRPDDFKSQPSGDSGSKIACGRINPLCSF